MSSFEENPVKICHINTTFIYKAGSTCRTFAVIRALADRGYRVIQIAGRDFEPHQEWNLSGIKFVRIPELVKYINPVEDIIALYKLYKILKRYKPQVVHTHLAKAGVLGRLAARLIKVPHIIHTVHGPTFPKRMHPIKKNLYRLLERFCGRFTDYFVFVGEELRDEYIKNGVSPLDKTIVIRSGSPESDFIAAEKFSENEIKSIRRKFSDNLEAFLIGYVARLVPSKAQDSAIRVLKLLRNKGIDAHLVLIGEGHLSEEKKYEVYLRRLTDELNLSGFTHFAGFQSHILPYMKAMDLLIMTSRYEGLPTVAVEACIIGKPLVAFKVCGISEVITDNLTGCIVQQGDIKGMAEKLYYLATNPEIRRKMGENATFNVREQYNLPRMIEEKLKFYQTVLKA